MRGRKLIYPERHADSRRHPVGMVLNIFDAPLQEIEPIFTQRIFDEHRPVPMKGLYIISVDVERVRTLEHLVAPLHLFEHSSSFDHQ